MAIEPLGIAEGVAALLALAAGYLAGSIPASALVGRRAGAAGARDARDVWRLAGPGPGLLAAAAELARGALPVAVAAVTLSWGLAWVAGAGAAAGAAFPLLGRREGAAPDLTFIGAAYALEPAAGALAVPLALLVALLARATGRDAVRAGTVAWLSIYPLLFLVAVVEPVRAVALVPLYAALLAARGWVGQKH